MLYASIGLNATLAWQGVSVLNNLRSQMYYLWSFLIEGLKGKYCKKERKSNTPVDTKTDWLTTCLHCSKKGGFSPAVGLLKMKYTRLWDKWKAVEAGIGGIAGGWWGVGALVCFWGRGWLWAERQQCLVIWPTIPFNPRTLIWPPLSCAALFLSCKWLFVFNTSSWCKTNHQFLPQPFTKI